MYEAQKYAKEAIKTLKVSEICPFDEIKALSAANKMDICKGVYMAWEVLELMIMLDFMLREQKNSRKGKENE